MIITHYWNFIVVMKRFFSASSGKMQRMGVSQRFDTSMSGLIAVSKSRKSCRSAGDITSGIRLLVTFRSVKVMAMRCVIDSAGALRMERVGLIFAILEMGYLRDLSAQRTIRVSPLT